MNITLTKRQQEFLLLNGWLQLQCGHAERMYSIGRLADVKS